MPLLEFTKKGIYCRQADVHIDPWRAVHKALITHAHSDHARRGSKNYLCTHITKPLLKLRLGQKIKIESVDYGEKVMINGVRFSFHPAGHIAGSAQIRVEWKGEIWVASGDYKTEDDAISGSFEPVQCHTFITESTFGLPIFKWPIQQQTREEIHTWWRGNQSQDTASIITAYSLGKAQRLVGMLSQETGPIYCHNSVAQMNSAIRAAGVSLPGTKSLDETVSWKMLKNALIIAPSASLASPWANRIKRSSIAFASGWMVTRKTRQWQAIDRGFILSDHADWNGLMDAIDATGAQKIIVTHGFTNPFARWLNGQGFDARSAETLYGDDNGEEIKGRNETV
jgi:putative mRNA 3-end processing factor